MTVQSIDKRLVPDTNMTAVTQDKQQAGVSAEDAFMAVLQQTTQRFASKAGGVNSLVSGDKVLSEHITHLNMQVKVDKRQDAQDNSQPVAKDTRTDSKTDKPRQANSTKSKSDDKQDDTQSAAASVSNDDDQPNVQTADSGKPKQDKAGKDDDSVQTTTAAKAKDDEEMIVEIDVTITETVQVVQVQTQAQDGPKLDLSAMAQGAATQVAAADDGKTQQDPLANLSADDRKRITDLENRLVNDVQNGNADDALDAATQLVSQIVAKVGQHKAAATETAKDNAADSLADQQAQDLAAMLGNSNVHLDVKVQTNTTDAAPVTLTTGATDSLSLLDLAAQATQGQGNQEPQQDPNQGAKQDTGAAIEPAAITLTQDAGAAQADAVDAHPFAAILAAQVEASSAQEAAPEPANVVNLTGITGAQAADKASAGQAAQSAARTPRTLVQQAQVMEQVSVQIDKQVKDGADTIKINLKPVELGKIEIKLEVSADGQVKATVTADKPETLALLQKDAKGLEKALSDAGLKPDSSATSFSLKGGEQQQNADRGNNNTRSRRGRSRGGNGGDGDASLAGAGAVQSGRARSLGGRSGVDISV